MGKLELYRKYRPSTLDDAEILKINKGDRICQLAIREVPKIEWEIVLELSETNRGANGFGSSGK